MVVDFFQHDNCIGNEIQRKVLEDCGFNLNVYSILDIKWKPNHLYLFFKNDPVYTWFDYSAPTLEKELFDPYKVTSQEALEFMVADRKLIKRPLIHFNGEYCNGFETELVKQMLELKKVISPDVIKNGNLCANFKSWKAYKREKLQ